MDEEKSHPRLLVLNYPLLEDPQLWREDLVAHLRYLADKFENHHPFPEHESLVRPEMGDEWSGFLQLKYPIVQISELSNELFEGKVCFSENIDPEWNDKLSEEGSPSVSLSDFGSVLEQIVATPTENGGVELSLPKEIQEQVRKQFEEDSDAD